jgi:magnesium transporter
MQMELASKNITWVNLEAPTNEELAAFVRESNLERADAEFIVQDHHRPEIAMRDGYILLLVQIPTFDKQARVTMGVPLYFLISATRLWTLHYEYLPSLREIWQDFEEKPAKQEEYFSDTPLSLALTIISHLNQAAFHKLEKLHKHIEIVADAVFHGNERKMVEEIAILNRDVMDFRAIMRPQRGLFSMAATQGLFDTETREQWVRLNGQMQKLWDFLESITENMQELSKTNTSLLQHKENELLRLLTFYSIITIPVWAFLSPFTPSFNGSSHTPLFSEIIYWSTIGVLSIVLIVIFLRFRGKSVL